MYGMVIVRLAFVLTLVACGGSGSSSSPDAASGSDAGPTVACTGLVYDACTDNTQCASQNCHLYNANALQICTQACSATVPCPADAKGSAVACNMMGNCKPTFGNNCFAPK
jgi:hypothetical protein